MLAIAFAVLKKIPLRYWEYLGLALLIISSVLWYNHHEREIGRQALEAKIKQVQEDAQARIDAVSDEQNKKLQAQYNAVKYQPLNLTLPVDCGSVPDDVRMRVNAAHQPTG